MLAIIGGSGLYSLGDDFSLDEQASRGTPFGATSADIMQGHWQDIALAFIPRHGPGHKVPPHRVNYRANIWALKQLEVTQIIAVNAVGGITPDMSPLTLALPPMMASDTGQGRVVESLPAKRNKRPQRNYCR